MFVNKKQADYFLFLKQFGKLKHMELEFQTAFLKKKLEAEGIFSFYCMKPENFTFLPGQYVDITLPIDGRDETYSFTLSSTPEENELIFTTRQSGSLYKKALFSIQKGQRLVMRGPLGGFVISGTDKKNLIFLAGGIGITPFRSMMFNRLASSGTYKIFLFASFSKREDMVFYREFQEIMEQNKNISIIWTLSNENNKEWEGEKGRINEELLRKYIPNLADCHFFVAGGNDMVDDTVLFLQKMGVENKYIKTDTFTGY
ncbi:MAG TPA: FAD-dependent oxidoreductase [Candidatus Saccharimonadales bacterium]|nr:FAD-dependent oxidoreductase [Candidatus Saccharimonadales bacterium]